MLVGDTWIKWRACSTWNESVSCGIHVTRFDINLNLYIPLYQYLLCTKLILHNSYWDIHILHTLSEKNIWYWSIHHHSILLQVSERANLTSRMPQLTLWYTLTNVKYVTLGQGSTRQTYSFWERDFWKGHIYMRVISQAGWQRDQTEK